MTTIQTLGFHMVLIQTLELNMTIFQTLSWTSYGWYKFWTRRMLNSDLYYTLCGSWTHSGFSPNAWASCGLGLCFLSKSTWLYSRSLLHDPDSHNFMILQHSLLYSTALWHVNGPDTGSKISWTLFIKILIFFPWLYSPWRTLAASHIGGFLSYLDMVGLLGWVISSSQGLYLHRTTEHRKTRTNIHALSGIRTHDPSNQPA
jgi:hypothetical protein